MNSLGERAMSRQVRQYHLTTQWSFAAPIGPVWAELSRPEGWPAWWRGIVRVQVLEQGATNGVGAYRRIDWQGAIPSRRTFNIRTVRVEPRALIESVADGSITGVGRWQLRRVGAVTQVRHDWIVNVPLSGVPVLAAVEGLLFRLNHRSLMDAGRRGLAGRVAAYDTHK